MPQPPKNIKNFVLEQKAKFNMAGPVLWGPNSISNNLQNSILNANGQQLAFNGSKNYLTNPTIELGTTSGWSLGTTTLTANLPTGTPTFASGASGNLTLSATSTTPLSGIYSLSYASSTATTAGNFVASDAFVVDSADLGKVLNFSFYYKATSNPSNGNWSGTTSNSFAVAIYDVTAGAANWIIPVGVFNIIQSANTGICSGSFQSSVVSGQQYRIVVYNANATAGAITMYFDQLFVGPSSQSASSSPVILSAFKNAGSSTANTTIATWTTVNRDTTAAFNASTGVFTVPVSGDYIVLFSAQTTSGTPVAQILKNGSLFNQGMASSTIRASCSMIVPGLVAGDTIAVALDSSLTFASNTTGTMLSIAMIQSAGVGPAGQVVAASAHITSGTTVVTPNPFNFDTIDLDTTGSITTGAAWKFVAPVSGNYYVETTLTFGGAADVVLYKNAAKYRVLMTTGASGSAGGTIVPLNAGDNIYIAASANAAPSTTTAGTIAQSNSVTIFLLQAPSPQQASASVNARYFASATSISGSLATVVWTTKDFDSAAGMSSGVYTIPVTGKYQVNTALLITGTIALNNNLILEIQKNGTVVSRFTEFFPATLTDGKAVLSDIISCVAGDTIRIQASSSVTGPSIVSSNFDNYFSISLVGN